MQHIHEKKLNKELTRRVVSNPKKLSDIMVFVLAIASLHRHTTPSTPTLASYGLSVKMWGWGIIIQTKIKPTAGTN